VPLTVWIAGGVAIVATIVLAGGIWFDRLFESPGAVYAPSLVQHCGSRSVLAVFAHPDDETLVAGALADAASRDGITVRTITLTMGEAGVAEPKLSRTEDIRLIRESELRRYGFALGIDYQEVWDYPDGQLTEVAESGVVDRLVERMRTWKPDLVLTFEPATGYNGHEDHRAAGLIATEAVRGAVDSRYRLELGTPHRPASIAYVLAPTRAFSTLGASALRAVAVAQPPANLAVPVDPKLRILGWRIHASQHLERAYPLPGWLLFDFWDKEHYRVVDPGGLND
jgi:LmbE family N-acetylglucosaminyl deacetylase